VAVSAQHGVAVEELRSFNLKGCTRLFIKTANSELWARHIRCFVKGHIYLTEDAAHYLCEQGILLLGFDYLSVDRYADPSLPAHRILLGHGIPIVESLNLSQVSPGEYQLVCAPLLLAGAEAAPARVFLLAK